MEQLRGMTIFQSKSSTAGKLIFMLTASLFVRVLEATMIIQQMWVVLTDATLYSSLFCLNCKTYRQQSTRLYRMLIVYFPVQLIRIRQVLQFTAIFKIMACKSKLSAISMRSNLIDAHVPATPSKLFMQIPIPYMTPKLFFVPSRRCKNLTKATPNSILWVNLNTSKNNT